MIIDTYYTD